MPLRYSERFMREVADYASKHGHEAAHRLYGTSVASSHRWMKQYGYPPKPIGAPKGNFNARGGRVGFRYQFRDRTVNP